MSTFITGQNLHRMPLSSQARKNRGHLVPAQKQYDN